MKQYIINVMCRSLAWEKTEELAACVARGYGVIVLDKDKGAYAGLPVDHFVACDVTDVASATALALAYVAQHGLAVAGVVGWTDTGVHLVAQLASRLRLPGTDPARIDGVKDKASTRQLLEAVPGANPPYRTGASVADLAAAIDAVGLPCMLKYPGASGGRGILPIDTAPADMDALYGQFRAMCDPAKDAVFKQQSSQFVVERKLRGSEHSVAGLVRGGHVTILAIVDKQVDAAVGYQYQNTVPSALAPALQERMCAMARQAITLSGIDACGFHVDMMVEDGVPYVLEMGGRLGGECINSHIIPLATGELRPYAMLIDIVSGADTAFDADYRHKLRRAASMLSLYGTEYGKVLAVEGLEAARQVPGVEHIVQIRGAGDALCPPAQKYNALAYAHVLLTHEQPAALHQASLQVRQRAAVQVEGGAHGGR